MLLYCVRYCGNAVRGQGQEGEAFVFAITSGSTYQCVIDLARGPVHLTKQRKFLFLQGPHGPFFRQLATKLLATGASVERIGFNRGDLVFWRGNAEFTEFNDTTDKWEAFLDAHLTSAGITDIVLYGDSRPFHKIAREISKRREITAHCFEEGYLRPYWATYERGGTNGNSRLMDLDMADIRRAVATHPIELSEVPAQWGAAWHHAFYGFLYHLFLSVRGQRFANYRPHRKETVLEELREELDRREHLPYMLKEIA